MENGNVIIRSPSDKNALQKWWRNRSRRQRNGTYCLLGIITGLVILILVYRFCLMEKPVVCTTPDCHSTALEILNYIDENQDPCSDFYKFACGKFLTNPDNDDPYSKKSVKILMEENIQSDLIKMLEEPIIADDSPSYNLVKKFYNVCMNEEGIERQGLKKLLTLFDQIGGWPVLEGNNWNRDLFLWGRAVGNLRAVGINFDFFFNVSVDIDRKHPEKYILGIHNKYFGSSKISPNAKEAFLNYMVDVTSQFEVKSENLWEELKDVLEFSLTLGEISKKFNNPYLYNLYTLSELQYEFSGIKWKEYLQGVLGSAAILNFDDIVSVSEPEYIKTLVNILGATDKRTIANYMGWQILQSLINYLPAKISDKAYEYLIKVNGPFARQPRSSVCMEATRSRLSPALNLAFIERYFDEDILTDVRELIRNVKIQFKKNILMLDWLDEETKRTFISTLASSVERLYSFSDFSEFNEDNFNYDNVRIEENKLLKAVLDLDLIFWDQYYGLLRKPVKDDWIKTETFISGLTVKYSAKENILKFPLGLLRGIYYNKLRPDYINYGLLGSVFAHQISHTFVEAKYIDVGEFQTAEEKLISRWSPLSKEKYVKKLECLSSQHEKLNLEDLDNIHTDPVITRDEDVADVAGYKVAYDSYLEREWKNGPESLLPGLEYSARQLFWISSALQFCSKYSVEYLRNKYSGNGYQHSPNSFRVNGPLQNLDEFSYDFGCSQGSYMNPYDKCYIW